MKFRVTPELVERVGRADKAAVHGLIEASHRTLHNVLYRATGDRARARDLARRAFKHVMGRLKEMLEPDANWSAFLLDVARDAAFDGLPGDEYRDTVFAKARDLITEPVEVEALPVTFLDRDETWGQDFDTGFKSALTPAQLMILELIFIERCPIAQLAEALDVSENMLGSYVYTVFDMLGDMASLEHREGCAPDLFLGIKIVGLEADPEGLARLEADHQGCYSCLTVIRRCLKIIRLFQIDSRLAAKAEAGLVDEVAAVPARKAAPMVAGTGRPLPAVPIVAQPAPEGVLQRSGRLVLAGVILSAFTFVAFRLVDPSKFSSKVVIETKRKGPKVLGTFSNPFVSNQPITEGLVIQSARNHKTEVALESGVALLLQPGAAVQVQNGKLIVMKGQVGISAPRGTAIKVGNETIAGALDEGELVVDRDAGKHTKFAVLKGDITLDGGGGAVRVDALRQASQDEASAKVSVVDLKDQELAAARRALPVAAGSGTSVAGGGGTGSGSSGSSARSVSGYGGYPAARAGRSSSGGGAGGSGTGTGATPPAQGTPAGGAFPSTPPPATGRSYKDYF